jgi:uncharacterized protein (TIGR02145 family)/uncharacterized repeat protein (TIGR02543 family)
MNSPQTLTANFQLISVAHYTLTVAGNPAAGGMVSRNPDLTSYAAGTEVTVTATPAEGYTFVNWSGASTSTNHEIELTINNNLTLTANFELTPPDSYPLEIVINPAGSGTVSRDPNEEIYQHGTEVTVTAAPNQGYVFTGWSGASISEEREITVTMNNPQTLTANFQLISVAHYTLTVAGSPAAGGMVSRSPDLTSYAAGTEVTVTAVPAEGYRFINWSGASTSETSEVTITVNNNMTLTANFELIEAPHYTLTVNRSPAVGGTVSREPERATYSQGTQVTVTADPAEGYRFIGWTGTASTSTEPEVTVTVTNNMTLTANFELKTYTLAIGTNSADGGTLRINNTITTGTTTHNHGTQITVTAEAMAGYTFINWSGASNSTNTTITITMNDNRELTANFRLNTYTLTTGVSSAGGGTVSRDPNQTEYTFGTQVIITATPLNGYIFAGWSGALTSANLTEVITLDNNKALIANFQPIPVNQYTLAIDRIPVNGGNVSRSPEAASYAAGTSVTVTAEPAAGHTFIGWSGASTSASPSITITMNTPTALTANFRLNTYTLTTDITPTNGGTVRVNNVVSTGATTHNHGTLINISAANNPGYRFVNWTVANGTAAFTNANNANTTVTLSANATIRANFQRVRYTLTINGNPTAGGTFTPASGLSHDSGAVNISATTASGYRFVNWTVASGTATFANANNATTTVTLSSNATIRANFQQIGVLTIDRNPIAGGTVTPASGQSHDVNTPVSITAMVASGYRFVNWTLVSATGTATFANANSAITTVTLSSNATIRANFQQTGVLTIDRNPIAGGTVTPASGQSHDVNTPVSITATTASGYRFVNWTVTSGTATFANVNSATTTVTLSSNATIRANFQQIGVLTIDRNPIAGGTVIPASGQSHDVNTPISITATVTSGYRFVNWTLVSATGTATFANANNAITTVTLSSNATIRANFVRIFTLTISSNPTVGGTFTPASGLSHDSGVVVNISATPATNYAFINWTITSGTATFASASSANTTVTLSSNATIRANFQQAITDQRDGQVYRIVTIGTQTWMAENLNWAGDNGNLGACYNNSASNCNTYGRLYNWHTVMAGSPSSSSSPSGRRGICPVGWHVPSDAEWMTLVNFVSTNGTGGDAGTRLKSTTGWSSDGNGTDNFGFSALPGGISYGGDTFHYGGRHGRWWCATEDNASDAWYRYINWDFSNVGRYRLDKGLMSSLRCLAD